MKQIKIVWKIIRIPILILSIYSLIVSIKIYDDYMNYKDEGIKICRYNNIINATGTICYGDAKLTEDTKIGIFWVGNHVWNITKENKRIDKSCPGCKEYKIFGCLKIKNGYLQEFKMESFKDIFLSFYFTNFSILKKLDIIN